MSDTSPLLSVRAAAAHCGVDERSVRRWIAQGRLPADTTSGPRRIRAADLAPFLVQRSGPTTADTNGHAAVRTIANLPTVRSTLRPDGPDHAAADTSGLAAAALSGTLVQFFEGLTSELERTRQQLTAQAEQVGRLQAERDQLAAQLAAAMAPTPTPTPWWRVWLSWWRNISP